MAIYFTNVKTRIIRELQEASTPVHWTVAEMIDAANDTVERFQLDTAQVQTNAVYTVTPNTNQYTYKTNTLLVLSGWYDGDSNEVFPTDRQEYVQANGGSETGDPTYILEADVPDKFVLYPAGVTNKELKLVYIKKLTDFTSTGSTELRNTKTTLKAITFGALSVLWRREGKNRNPERAMLYDDMYRNEANGRLNRSRLARRYSIAPGGKDTDRIKADYGNDL